MVHGRKIDGPAILAVPGGSPNAKYCRWRRLLYKLMHTAQGWNVHLPTSLGLKCSAEGLRTRYFAVNEKRRVGGLEWL
jgi:hypothetical protein